jgi:hypothetical protein
MILFNGEWSRRLCLRRVGLVSQRMPYGLIRLELMVGRVSREGSRFRLRFGRSLRK